MTVTIYFDICFNHYIKLLQKISELFDKLFSLGHLSLLNLYFLLYQSISECQQVFEIFFIKRFSKSHHCLISFPVYNCFPSRVRR